LFKEHRADVKSPMATARHIAHGTINVALQVGVFL